MKINVCKRIEETVFKKCSFYLNGLKQCESTPGVILFFILSRISYFLKNFRSLSVKNFAQSLKDGIHSWQMENCRTVLEIVETLYSTRFFKTMYKIYSLVVCVCVCGIKQFIL